MISEISLKFGAKPGDQPLKFLPGHMTIVVGPNFSGKSKLIREIQHYISHGRPSPDNVILQDLVLPDVEEEDVDELIESVRLQPNPGELVNPENVIVGRLNSRSNVPRAQLRAALLNFNTVPHSHAFRTQAAQWFHTSRLRMLNAESRISLTNEQPMGDLSHGPTNTFQQLFRDDVLRTKVRKIVEEAFGLHLVVDPTSGGQLRLRLSDRAPADTEEERSLSERAVSFHSNATLLSQTSDGTRAFCGILTEVMAGNPDLLLLDEPEAFLHPGLSYKLGLEMARQVQSTDKKIVVSTHSANFLMGCVSAGIAVNVLRLTYKNGVATARLLPANDLRSLMKNPLLRSANVLSGLFYENVIVCEADSDRAFYQEINHRLLREGKGMVNALFLNANGKGSMPTIVKPLKDLGVSVGAIYDLDFIKDGGSVLTSRLNAASVPSELHDTIRITKDNLRRALDAKASNYKTAGGTSLLETSELPLFESLNSDLSKHGIFLVPVGEVEGWLSSRDISGHGPSWLIEMFTSLGDEDSDEYVSPSSDDVWGFIDGIGRQIDLRF